ncbi:mucin-3A-like isoform X10 [Parambassis ranga]|uniref:Mucin-3A-like isoform X10 n=1 Tax=Parambassis ranga TaxID=210632 RepID=A0A6P7I562_9TELE|nr:mucin-3A-like isoform X10 [Parambassis ranga]
MRGISGLLLLLLLPVCSSQSNYMGTVITYNPKNPNADGSISVVLHYKLNSRWCNFNEWTCVNCGTEVSNQPASFYNGSEFCEIGRIVTRLLPSSSPFQMVLNGGSWVSNINNITSMTALIHVDLRSRSDTGRANTSPQTNILPKLRVPSNCQRNFTLLAFDPDGDDVKCTEANSSLSECVQCTPPLSVLTLHTSCFVSYNPSIGNHQGNEGSYALQLMMVDFPMQTITLTNTSGSQEVKTTNDAISRIPIQFIVTVDPAVQICQEGFYLPRFLPPTPANRAQLFTFVGQTLEISIHAEANHSSISQLVFSGPSNMIQSVSGAGQFILTWTPSEAENGETHAICFVVEAELNRSAVYQSELRCVIVAVGSEKNFPTDMTTIQPATTPPAQPLNTTTQTSSTPCVTSQPSLTITITQAVPSTTCIPLTTQIPVTVTTPQTTTTPTTIITQATITIPSTTTTPQNITIAPTMVTTSSGQSTFTIPLTVTTANTTTAPTSPIIITITTPDTTTPGGTPVPTPTMQITTAAPTTTTAATTTTTTVSPTTTTNTTITAAMTTVPTTTTTPIPITPATTTFTTTLAPTTTTTPTTTTSAPITTAITPIPITTAPITHNTTSTAAATSAPTPAPPTTTSALTTTTAVSTSIATTPGTAPAGTTTTAATATTAESTLPPTASNTSTTAAATTTTNTTTTFTTPFPTITSPTTGNTTTELMTHTTTATTTSLAPDPTTNSTAATLTPNATTAIAITTAAPTLPPTTTTTTTISNTTIDTTAVATTEMTLPATTNTTSTSAVNTTDAASLPPNTTTATTTIITQQ